MKEVLMYVMGALYILTGILHFLKTGSYLRIMPSYIPWHKELVYLSGVVEIVGGSLLFFPQTKIFAAWLIIVLLIAVFPANINMMMIYKLKQHPYFWATVVRLPLQLLLIWWAWQYTR